MIFWNYKTPLTLLSCVIWNCSERFGVSLGKYAPAIFSMALGIKGKTKNPHSGQRGEKSIRQK